LIILIGSAVLAAPVPIRAPGAALFATGLEGGAGSTIGPGGALYVTERIPGRISRVDPQTGAITTFASGLPAAVLPLGGVMDVAFFGKTAYALVTLVGPDVGGGDVVGIYRIDGPSSFTVIADIGAYAINNPVPYPVDVPSGVQYALDIYQGDFLVTDGHHNRVYRVTRDGEIDEQIAFANTVPTGLEIWGNTVFMAEAGPVPHLPEDGKILTFGSQSASATAIAAGAPLLVDVERGLGGTLYALSQGDFPAGGPPGSPAMPDSGALVEVTDGGTLSPIVEGLNQPTSMQIIGNSAYVVTLGGEIWKIDGIASPPFGGPLPTE
jgi:hypothetical protein